MNYEKSCGTIIIDKNRVLIVKQKSGFFGFPKGHMESNETEEETAVRETKEETNIDVKIDSKLRFPIFYQQKANLIKEVIYFVARPIGKINEQKQEQEISEILWVKIDDVRDILTFDNLKELWDKVLMKISN